MKPSLGLSLSLGQNKNQAGGTKAGGALGAGMKGLGTMNKSPSGGLGGKKMGLGGKKGGIAPYAPPKSEIEDFLNSTSAVSGYTPHVDHNASAKTSVQHPLRRGANLIQDVSVEDVYFDQLIIHAE